MKKISFKILLPKAIRENKLIKGKKNLLIPVGIIIGVIIILSILESSFGLLSTTFMGQETIKEYTKEILGIQKQIQIEQGAYRDILDREAQFISQKNEYWITQRDGDMNQSFQQKISSAASKASVDLSTAGSVQVSKISDDLSIGEVEISCSGSMEEITKFIYALTYSTPKMYWERFSLRPDNYNSKGTIYMTCDAKFLIISNKDIITLFGIGEKND
ncbi:MAG TPA: hypothetical protein DD381_03180 [Lentisphaeria bacterium]|nr:MAG: hypothetical protein A2X47_03070 [Lentisphaerae bacterium GWF2_38_69]HBM15336.1 hypothetical protein [Lentisphaeria bacterium]